MKKEFKEFYEYSDSELKEIWKDAIFIFDTNILFGLYRLPDDSRDDLLKILKKLKSDDRIWTPHQVLYEFHKKRRKIIIGLEKDYNVATQAIKSFSKKIPASFKGELKSACENHPLLDSDKIYSKVENSLKDVIEEIESVKSNHPDWSHEDTILKEVEDIFLNFGNEYQKKELDKIYDSGDKRYKEKIPPGYADCKKIGNDRFGDFIIWNQILDYAKTINKSIIFITNDVKEDWWILEYDKPVRPRFELRKEIFSVFKYEFEMYTLDMFLEKSKIYLSSKITDESISEIRKIRESEAGGAERISTYIEIDDRIASYYFEDHLEEYVHVLSELEKILRLVREFKIRPKDLYRLNFSLDEIKDIKLKVKHGGIDKELYSIIKINIDYLIIFCDQLALNDNIGHNLSVKLRTLSEKLLFLSLHRL